MKQTFVLLFLLTFTSWYQRPLSFVDTYGATSHYPESFPTVIRPVEETFQQDSLYAVAVLGKMWDYYNYRQWENLRDSSITLYMLAEKLLEQKINTGVVELWADGFVAHGQALVYLGELEAGARIMNEGFAIRQRILGDNYMLAVEHYGAGHMAMSLLDDPELALDYYRAGEAIVRKVLKPEDPRIFNGTRNLSMGYFNKGDVATGLMYYQQIFDSPHCPPKSKPGWHVDLASMLINNREYEKALFHLELGKPNDTLTAANFSRVRLTARAYLGLKRYDECARQLKLFEDLVRMFKVEAEERGTHVILLELQAYYYAAVKNLPRAIEKCRAAIAAAEQRGTGKASIEVLELWQTLAGFYVKNKQLAEAKHAVNELLLREARFQSDDFTQNPSLSSFTRQPHHLSSLHNKGLVLELEHAQSGNSTLLEAAVATYEKADSLIEILRDTYRGVGSKNQMAGIAKPIYQRAIHCAFRLWEKTGNQQFLEKAWAFSEKSKAIGLLEAFRDSEARQMSPINRQDLEYEARLKRNLGYFEKMVFEEQNKPSPNSDRLSHFNRRISDLNHTQDSLQQVFKYRYPEYYQLRCDKKIAGLTAMRDKLGAGNAMVSYFMGEGELFIFLIDAQQFKVFRYETDSSFVNNIERMRASVNESRSGLRSAAEKQHDFEEFVLVAHTLYQTLLAEPLKHTPVPKLVVAPDDIIGYVPFAALLIQPVSPTQTVDYRNLPYLVQQRTIRFEYSGSLMNTQLSKSGARSYLGIAPNYSGPPIASRGIADSLRFNQAFGTTRNSQLASLKYNTEEVRTVGSVFGGRFMTGPEASEGNFKKYAPQASVLHLPMHALVNDTDPLFSTLVFSPGLPDSSGYNDGFLHAYELYNLRLRANLVVLSACQTGVGKVEKGEGIMSLARAFKFAGCPNIMMSLWSVNDYAAQTLITSFFAQLNAGAGKAGALQNAQKTFLSEIKADELTHPYYWASFVMVGDDMPLPPSKTGFLMISLLLISLVLLSMVLLRK